MEELIEPCNHCKDDELYLAEVTYKGHPCLYCGGTGIQPPPPIKPTFTEQRREAKKNEYSTRL